MASLVVRMTLEERPYLSFYLDGQLKAQRGGRRRRVRSQAYRRAYAVSWTERLVGATLLLGAACSLLLAVLLALGLVWLIGTLLERWLRG